MAFQTADATTATTTTTKHEVVEEQQQQQQQQQQEDHEQLDLATYYTQGASPPVRLLPDPLPNEDVLWIPPQLCKSSYELLVKSSCNARAWNLEGRFGSRTHRVVQNTSSINTNTGNTNTNPGEGGQLSTSPSSSSSLLMALPILSHQIVLETAQSNPELQALLDMPLVQLAQSPFAVSHWANPPPHIDARIHPERAPHIIPNTIHNNNHNKKSYSFTFLELFAGIGGFGVALEALGGTCIFCSELDSSCRAVYQQNLHCPPTAMHGDIYQVPDSALPSPSSSSSSSLLACSSSLSMSSSSSCDLLVGGFPCQPFSALGTQPGLECPKGHLFLEIVRVLKVSQPKAFLLENVPGLQQLTATYDIIVHALEEAGYAVWTQVCNARAVTATTRKRLFLVGILRQPPNQPSDHEKEKEDDDDTRDKAGMVNKTESSNKQSTATTTTVEPLFEFPFIPDLGLRAMDIVDYYLGDDDEDDGQKTKDGKDDVTTTRKKDSHDNNNNNKDTNKDNTDANTSNDHDDNDEDVNQDMLHDDKHLIQLLRLSDTTFQQLVASKRWRPSSLAWPGTVLETLISHYGTAVGRGESQLVPCRAPHVPRRLSPRECARLMGFPNSYVLGQRRDDQQGDMAYIKERYRMFGNAVCPPLVAALAGAVLHVVKGGRCGTGGKHDKDKDAMDLDWVEWGRQTAIRLALAATIPKESRRTLPLSSLPFDNLPQRNPEKKTKKRKGNSQQDKSSQSSNCKKEVSIEPTMLTPSTMGPTIMKPAVKKPKLAL
jgi:DNA-cytosine methyltransferase